MARRVILASLFLAGATAACVSPIKAYQGYTADEIQPGAISPGVDTRASVLAQLGSPSTESIFDQNTWFYIYSETESLAYFKPKVSKRVITAIVFNETDVVEEVLEYNETDGRVINYASRETPTRGRELGLLEQIFGNVGRVALPQTDERTPGNPTGRQ